LADLLHTGNHSQVVDIAIVQNADDSLNRPLILVVSVHRVQQAIILLNGDACGCLLYDQSFDAGRDNPI
jgi:hypothetical protein